MDAQIEAGEKQDMDQIGEYMAESIYMRHTVTFGDLGLGPEIVECTGREECIAELEEGMAPISDYEISVSDVEVSIAPDGRSATVDYTQHESGVLDGTPFRAEAQATDEYEVEDGGLVITRSEGHTELSFEQG